MTRIAIVLAGLLALVAPQAAAQALPPLKPQPNAEMTVAEHLSALSACDWNRLMAQYPEEILIILPNGEWIEGRGQIGELFKAFCQPRQRGGYRGAIFFTEKVKTIGDTVSVSWRVEAPWLAEPYKGADAYVTRDGLLYVQVTTFDPAQMVLR